MQTPQTPQTKDKINSNIEIPQSVIEKIESELKAKLILFIQEQQRKIEDNQKIIADKLENRVTREELAQLIRSIDKRFEEQKEYMKQYFEQINKRFEQVDKRFEQVDKRFEQVDKRFEDMNKRFHSIQWMMGIGFLIIPVFITVLEFLR